MEEKEIDLIDYIVVLKKKWLLLLITIIIFASATLIFLFLSKNSYSANAILEIGTIGKERSSDFFDSTNVEPPAQVVNKISNNAYDVSGNVKAENPLNTNLVVITEKSTNPEEAKNNLSELTSLIIEQHQSIIDSQRSTSDAEMAELNSKIGKLNQDLEKSKKLVSSWGAIDSSLQSPTFLLIYLNEKEKINKLENDIDATNLKIKEIAKFLAFFNQTKIVDGPTVSANPKIIKFPFIASILLGFFVGAFIIFLNDWWEKNKGSIPRK